MDRNPTGRPGPKTPGFAAAIVDAASKANLGIVVTSREGGKPRTVFENGYLKALFGAPVEGVDDVPLPDEDRTRLDEWRSDDRRSSGVIATELVSSRGGKPVDLIASRTRVDDRAAEALFVFDTAERVLAERALVASEARFRNLLDAAPDAIAIGTRKRFMYANPALVKILGYSSTEEVISQPLRSYLHPDDRSVAHGLVERLSQTGKPQPPTPIRAKKKDGEYVHVELSSMPIEWGGRPALLGIARDVSERKRVQSQLIRADRLTAVGTLAAGIAHEINNPLAYVLLNLQYLTRELPKYDGKPVMIERLLERLEEAQHGARRVSTIVSDLRAFARPAHEDEEPVSVASVMRSAMKVTSNAMRQRAQVVDRIYDSRPVLASAARLEQVFVNLLVNAAQAIPEGRPSDNQIVVSVHDRNRHVVVEVSDTGEGIAEDLLDRVFDPFFTTKPRGTGTGLGLPISHSIVASYGGEIAVNSVVKRGTTFRVTLPVFQGVLRSRSLTPPPGPIRAEQPRFRLLVVDDEPLVADMLERTLEENHEVTIATNANKALELLLDTTFDLVFCDLLMPGKSGMDLYEEVRQKRPGVEAKLIFMTGGAFTPRASQFLATVPNRTIVKPFDLLEIERVIAHYARRADHPKKD